MTANPPVFNRVASLTLYALSSNGDAGLPNYWTGYRPGPNALFGTSATLDQVWQDVGGVYLFLNQIPDDFTALLANLDALLEQISPFQNVRLLWLVNPNDSPGYWQLYALQALASGSGPAITWQTRRQALFQLGNYALQIQAQAVLTQADPATLGYGIALDAAFVTFIAPGGNYTPVADSAWLPLAGPALGAWTASLKLLNDGSTPQTSPDDLARLGTQLRYALPALSDPTGNGVMALPMPVLLQSGAQLTVALSFDPLNLLVPKRTNLAFFGPGLPATQPALGATFVTARGYKTTLTPLNPSAPLWGARLAFCVSPLFTTASSNAAYYDYYLAPDGAFALATTTPAALLSSPDGSTPVDRLTPGLSGLEYIGLSVANGTIALFSAGQPAYAPYAVASLPSNDQQEDASPLSDLATTAYLALLPPTPGAAGLPYFAQPRQAPLFIPGTDLGPGFMDFLEMTATMLPSYATGQAPPVGLPIGAYTGIDPSLTVAARLVEASALAPARRAAAGLPSAAAHADEQGQPLAVTPQGLLALLASDYSRWNGLVFANLPGAPISQLAFTQVGPAFQAALQASELFFVVSNVNTFMNSSSVSYQLDPASLALLPAAGVPQEVVENLNTLLAGMNPPYPVFPTESAFIQAIQPVAGVYVNTILPVAGLLKANLEGWTFQLSPRSWRTDVQTPTLMLTKYCNRSLEEMVAETGCWGWPEAAYDEAGSLLTTQTLLQEIFAAAAKAARETPDSPDARFYLEVVRNRNWNGVLFLNAPVAIAELPQELQFVTAGINTSQFYAHHVGFSLTSFDASTAHIILGQTSVFGLISYQDPSDLYLSSTVPFAFKTLSLSARFANAALVGFAVQVELMLNRLFGVELTKINPEHGNNLLLNGSYQHQNAALTYAFVLQGENLYQTAHSVLDSIEILGAQLQTTTGTGTAGSVAVDFVLAGNLRYLELPNFDLFSYGQERGAPAGKQPADGYLRFNNLTVHMSFPLATPDLQTFTLDEGALSFDLTNSLTRPGSLVGNFPLLLTNLIASPNLALAGSPASGQRPEDIGYTSIVAPLDQELLTSPWYGLVFTLDLGSLGALAGSAGLSFTLLAAWAPGTTGTEVHPVYLGLKLSNNQEIGSTWPLQGVMRLGFRSFQFQVNNDTPEQRYYMLRLHRLALSLLGWSLPPGTTDILLFGNPAGNGRTTLGWYAVYAANSPGQSSIAGTVPRSTPRTTVTRRLRSGRRILPPMGEQ